MDDHNKYVFSQNTSLFLGMLMGVFLFILSLTFVSAATEDVTVNATVPQICGNGTVEGTEECDDSNTTDGDGCSASCVVEGGGGGAPIPPPPPPPAPICGNGIPEGTEECDDGNTDSGDGCSASCAIEEAAPQICGNGIPEGTEECDDGNTDSGDGCSASCLLEFPEAVCGNGVIEGAEQCDDSNTQNGDGCSASCAIEPQQICGNGIPEGTEECDDNNTENGDGCSASCTIEIVFPIICGDGLVDAGEQCDDGNTESGDGCSVSCTIEGEPPVPPEEEPPEGEPEVGPEGGTPEGTVGICGNGIIEGAEQCDDNNTESGDGCSASCTIEPIVDDLTEAVEDIQDILSGDASLTEKALAIAQIISQQATDVIARRVALEARNIAATVMDGVQLLDELADNPTVEKVTEEIVAPAVITTAALAVIPSLWSILLPLLRFLFLQPFLLFGQRKRKEWGVVYNSLDKRPVDLAIVRLIDSEKKTIVRSRVTDKNGRYLFSVPPGKYILEVTKSGFQFPSDLLKGVSADGSMLDIYHGEVIEVTDEKASITPNIPMDPSGAPKSIKRVVWEKRLRVFQHVLSLGGLIATAVALYVSPTWYVGVFLAAHIVLYALFLRHIRPRKPKGWGLVYDAKDEKPVGKAVARLFSKQYDKLVATEMTDAKGRYAFLAGPSDYYVTIEKQGYEETSKEVRVKEAEQIVKESVPIKKAGGETDKKSPTDTGSPPQPKQNTT